jgi:hypothetical protein
VAGDDERLLRVADLDRARRHRLTGIVQQLALDVVDEEDVVAAVAVFVEVAGGIVHVPARLRDLLAGEGEQAPSENEGGGRKRRFGGGIRFRK